MQSQTWGKRRGKVQVTETKEPRNWMINRAAEKRLLHQEMELTDKAL